MKIFEIKKNDRILYAKEVAELEKMASYPLGLDAFKIDHGPDYFAFFDRLGEVHYYACEINNKIVAVACGIIRNIPERTFYLCDLKVHPDYRGKHIPLKILARSAIRYYLKCPRAYAISMDIEEQKENRVAKLFAKFPFLKIRPSEKLYFYSFNYEEIIKYRDLIELHKGPIQFLSLSGIKDLILESTKKSLPLLHIQYGEILTTDQTFLNNPMPENIHMMALTSNDELKLVLDKMSIPHSAKATVMALGMKKNNWKFIRTSDI